MEEGREGSVGALQARKGWKWGRRQFGIGSISDVVEWRVGILISGM